jgi:hypothetical protein
MTTPNASSESDEFIISASISKKGSRVSVQLLSDKGSLPDLNQPGVYRVFAKNSGRTFYIGETRHLEKRLRVLFRCYHSSNPHPCHSHYQIAYKHAPEPEDFCSTFSAAIRFTTHLTGRIEIEESLQEIHGCNHADFYLAWLKESKAANVQHEAPEVKRANLAKTGLFPENQKSQQEPILEKKPITKGLRQGAFTLSDKLKEHLYGKNSRVILHLEGLGPVAALVSSNGNYLNGARDTLKAWFESRPSAHQIELTLETASDTPCLKLTLY